MACQSIVSQLKLTLIRWDVPTRAAVEMSIVIPFKMTINHTTAVGVRGDAASGQIAWERMNEWMNQRGPSKLMLPSPRNPTGRLIVYILLTCQWHASNIFISPIMADSHYRKHSGLSIFAVKNNLLSINIYTNWFVNKALSSSLVRSIIHDADFLHFGIQTWTWTWTAGNYCAHTTTGTDHRPRIICSWNSFGTHVLWVNIED